MCLRCSRLLFPSLNIFIKAALIEARGICFGATYELGNIENIARKMPTGPVP